MSPKSRAASPAGPFAHPQGGGFHYNDRVHDKGEKIVLGVTIPAGGGKEDGEKVLDILAKHPSTARFISKKLAQRFVADDPPQTLIDEWPRRFATTERRHSRSDEDHADVEGILLAGRVSRQSEDAVRDDRQRGAGHRRARSTSRFRWRNRIAQLGEPLYRKLEPTGYSNANAEWVNSASLLARMNFALALAQNKVPGIEGGRRRASTDDPDAYRAADAVHQSDDDDARGASTRRIADQKAKNPKAPPSPALVAGLVLGSPDFQRS